MTKQLILVHGKPGCGKSTASRLTAEKLGDVYHFSMGDELRARALEGKPSKHSQALMEQAEALRQALPVPPQIAADVFEECVETSPYDTIIVDGYPQYPDRMPRFNETLGDVGAKVLAIAIIDVPDELAAERIRGRGQRAASVSEDDAYITKRLAGYVQNVEPTIEVLSSHYPVYHIDGSGSPDQVAAGIMNIVQAVRTEN
jgi:adenylate kinase